MLYWLVPRIFQTTIFSEKLVKTHFWIGTIGIALYAIPMYISGFTQGMMWKQFTAEGNLQYGNFLDTTLQLMIGPCFLG